MNNYELQHAGIKGMKWGVRRYQNKDGSLTVIGEARYRKSRSQDRYGQPKMNRARTMSDDELKDRINRLELERRYKDLKKTRHPKITAGKAFVGRVLARSAETLAVAAVTNLAGRKLKKMFNDPHLFDSITKEIKK